MTEPIWRTVTPMESRFLSCSSCKVKIHGWMSDNTMWACGKRTGRMGVRVCRDCALAGWALYPPIYPGKTGLRKCRGCKIRKERVGTVDGWNRICGECMDLLRKEIEATG